VETLIQLVVELDKQRLLTANNEKTENNCNRITGYFDCGYQL